MVDKLAALKVDQKEYWWVAPMVGPKDDWKVEKKAGRKVVY